MKLRQASSPCAITDFSVHGQSRQTASFKTDQGSQFTSREFTGVLEQQVAISMDGLGRALDNVFIERLWWSVKYEEVYLKAYGTVADLHEGLGRYFEFYDHERPHQSLEKRTPAEVFEASLASTAERRRRTPKYSLADSILN